MQTHFLSQFVLPVPSCALNVSLETVLDAFGWGLHDVVVVVDDRQAPIGAIRFRTLMADLLPKEVLSQSARPRHRLNLQQSLEHYQQHLTHQPHRRDRSLIEAMGIIPLNSALHQLRLQLATNPSQCWAVVDLDNRFLGMLDQPHLWQAIANQREHHASDDYHVEPSRVENSHLVGRAIDVERQVARSVTSDVPSDVQTFLTTILPLAQLLERLPIPLMLQTGTGQVLTQNLAWRQQLGELQDPYSIRQEAAVFLEAIADRPAYPNASACRLGGDENTCICVCPMKNGQERIWQFIKIPLGSILLEASLARISAAAQLDSRGQDAGSHFHLASLETNEEEGGFLHREPVTSDTLGDELWLVLAQDTTDQQQVAKELAAKNADLVQLNRLKDEFLACISHELKTPLTAILGLSSLLQDQLLGPLNERQSRYARLIHQGGRHLILIVNDILDLTRIETGQLDLNLDLVNIQAVCQRAYELAKQLQPVVEPPVGADAPVVANTGMTFTLEIQPGLVQMVADELRLRQMLTNLLSNAIKFTGVSGEIGLRVNVWEGWIAFTVWDTGIGIPADKQHLIFQKFQQLENPLTRQFEGTGLGLVLTQRLARLHGGDVTFTSAEGQGSEFTLLLPPSPPLAKSIGGSHWDVMKPNIMTTAKRLVLVVEAVPRFLENLTSQLTGLGYRVAIARSGTEALEKVRRLQPAAVFLNPLLPLLSGWDVLTLLKSDAETCTIPIVVTATHVEKTQAYSNGADGFLSLPVQVDALQRNLDHLANRLTTENVEEPKSTLTVLHLHTNSATSVPVSPPVSPSEPTNTLSISDLNTFLHPNHCRVLQVDDLDQADLLGRVWKPDLVLLDGYILEPLTYLKQLSQYPFLASLPLVTLTPEMTQAANQVPGLVVFPCLASSRSSPEAEGQPDALTLWQVMQVAAGTNWTSHLLIVDLATLGESCDTTTLSGDGSSLRDLSGTDADGQKTTEWLQALLQYIQTAGFRVSIGTNWTEVMQQVEHQSIDLLVLCIRHVEPRPAVIQAMQTLVQLESKPPILVWDCQPRPTIPSSDVFTNLLGAIATQILPPSLSMQELLDQINQTLDTK
jgi:signal transduction histidine kinase/FixJ family two-component response regulator